MNKIILKIIIIIVSLVFVGCSGIFDIYSPSQIHRTVRLVEKDIYIVSYKRRKFKEQYGENLQIAVPAYLRENKILPLECGSDVYIVRHGAVQGGGGWAEFKCKK